MTERRWLGERDRTRRALCATLVLVWVLLLLQTLFYCFIADNAILSVSTAVSDAGIEKDDLDFVCDFASVLTTIDEEDFDKEVFSTQSYRLIEGYAAIAPDKVAQIGVAWQYPRTSKKSLSAPTRYAGLAPKITDTIALLQKKGWLEKELKKPDVTLTREQWQESAKQLNTMAKNVGALSQKEWQDVCKGVHDLIVARDIIKEVSFKTMRKIARAALDITTEVSFSRLYIADLIFGEGFAQEVGGPVDELLVGLRRFEYADLVGIAFLLPDTDEALLALVRYAFSQKDLSIDAFCDLYVALRARGLVSWGGDRQSLFDAITYLKDAPEDPTEREEEKISAYLSRLKSCFSSATK
ncbi:MAG: hypothetical protein IJ735_02980 [Clostridia bacterium]|nr:hypothetical protein [Clostridia bacterium]